MPGTLVLVRCTDKVNRQAGSRQAGGRQAGLAFQELTSALNEPESVNNIMYPS